MKIRYFYNTTCHCCKDMHPIVLAYGLAKGIEVEEVEIETKPNIEMPQDLTGLPYTQLLDDDGNVIAKFQGATRYEILEREFAKNEKQ